MRVANVLSTLPFSTGWLSRSSAKVVAALALIGLGGPATAADLTAHCFPKGFEPEVASYTACGN